ncbi:ComEC/Rec2 family competence protein [Robinsoniella peoriensis]
MNEITRKFGQVTITKVDGENAIMGGSETIYNIEVPEEVAAAFDPSMIKMCGTLSESASLLVTGGGTDYQAVVTLPEEPGTIGLYVDDAVMMNGIQSRSAAVPAATDMVFTMLKTSERGKTGNDAAITLVIGVPDSFYIKQYTFTLNGAVKSTRTSNEFTYKGLTNGKTYTLGCNIEVYTAKDGDEVITKKLVKDNVQIPASPNAHMLEFHSISVTGVEKGKPKTGDCHFIRTLKGNTILIDCGLIDTANKVDKYLRETVGLKATNGVINIDYFINTHPHHDHIEGFERLTGYRWDTNQNKSVYNKSNQINKNVRYQFTNVVLGVNCKLPFMQSLGYIKNLIYYAEHFSKLKTVCAGNCFGVDGIIFNILSPYPADVMPLKFLSNPSDNDSYVKDYIRKIVGNDKSVDGSSSKNNQSIVMKIINGGRKILAMGDAELYTEELLLGKAADEADWDVKITDTINHINLAKDIATAEKITPSEAVRKYNLKRFTEKDLEAIILKKGHHGTANNMSLDFLKAVNVNKIIVSAEMHSATSPLAKTPLAVAQQYYNEKKLIINDNNKINEWPTKWQSFIFSTGKHGRDGGFFIRTYGRECDFSDPYSKKKY